MRYKSTNIDFAGCRYLVDEDDGEILYMLDRKFTQKQIAEQRGIHPSTVSRRIKRLLRKIEDILANRRKLTLRQSKAWTLIKREGMTYREAADFMNCSPPNIWHAVAEAEKKIHPK